MIEITIDQLNRPLLSFHLKFIGLNCVYRLIFYISFLNILILYNENIILSLQ